MAKTNKQRWNYQPDLSTKIAPYFIWPVNFFAILRSLLNAWSPADVRVYVLGFSVLSWYQFSPSLATTLTFELGWIAQIWLRHFLTLLVVAGGLHLYFYTFNKQGIVEKYDARKLDTNPGNFHFNNQVWDNMFWVLVGTVAFLTLYESIMMWAYANGIASRLIVDENPIAFLLLFLLIPAWTSFHFYWQHRAFHIPVLYKLGHHWHHKNINVGPWSGAAVHPLEALVWFSAVLILLALPSHPIHAIFLMQLQVITAITTHVGFESLIINGRPKLRIGDFYHQLHHRFYDCNYGTASAPWDRWFNSYHDGTVAGDDLIRKRRKMRKI